MEFKNRIVILIFIGNKYNMVIILLSIRNEYYRIEIELFFGNVVIVDELLEIGGKDLGFLFKELLILVLAVCISVILRMYVDRKGWDF